MGKTGKGGECMEAYAAYRVLMVEDDRGIAQAVQTQGELWNLHERLVRDLRNAIPFWYSWTSACPASMGTTGVRRSGGYPGFR